MQNKLIKVAKDPKKILIYAIGKGALSCLNDESYLRIFYRLSMNKKLDLSNPQTFNEKLQWLKLHDHRPEYTMMVDKYKVRKYIADKLGEKYLIPLLGVWDNPDEIDFDVLPNQFVLKCNHNSGLGMCICKDKESLDINRIKKNLKKGFKQNYYKYGREWPYKSVSRKIIAEKYMIDESGEELKDYKIHCFNGEPKFILVCSERFSDSGLKENFYDIDWNLLNMRRPGHSNTIYPIEKPECLNEMLVLAKKLSKNMTFVRIDFYVINKHIYFGEITFYPATGMENFEPVDWDYRLGSLIDLKNVQI